MSAAIVIAQAAIDTNPAVHQLPQELWDKIAKMLWESGVLSELLAQWEWSEPTQVHNRLVENGIRRPLLQQTARAGDDDPTEGGWTTARWTKTYAPAIPADDRAVLQRYGIFLPRAAQPETFKRLKGTVSFRDNSGLYHRTFDCYDDVPWAEPHWPHMLGVMIQTPGCCSKAQIMTSLEDAGIPFAKSWTKKALIRLYFSFPDPK